MSDHSRAPEAQAGYYARHIFFCLNERPNGEDCCALHGAKEGFDHCKKRGQGRRPGRQRPGAREQGRLPGPLRGGPVAVVYPEGTWYTFVDEADIDEIVDSHLKHGQVVERLLVPPELGR